MNKELNQIRKIFNCSYTEAIHRIATQGTSVTSELMILSEKMRDIVQRHYGSDEKISGALINAQVAIAKVQNAIKKNIEKDGR